MEIFDDTFIPPGLGEVWAGTRRCPRCVWVNLRPVTSHDQAHWRCSSCGRCYHLVHGNLRLVDPVTCHGCAARHKRDCITLLQHEFPHFAAGVLDTDDEMVLAQGGTTPER